ncbi:ABC-2 type transport system permease protein [Kroppenstedtia eburnea]|uniref:ABC-2 type transport system permease protein n=2 Tax=Kroppenstedtia eburnea TaxID=714067 RepID=A0A1N7KEZ2_9BACL|nr:ABC transporter permease [Kroppenstedtia eburnea]SIS60176.1 ABC-2 type transport system permease protein [Kroppenstedtia eburnea]
MFNFIRLVQNENMKIFRRVGTWVMIGLLLLATGVLGIMVKQNVYGDDDLGPNWKQKLEKQVKQDQKILKREDLPPGVKKSYEKSIQINQYRIDHDVVPDGQTLWGYMYQTANVASLITLFTIIIGATSVAGEFSWGTIKLLLIRSASRSKILLSKYLSTLLFALALLAILFLFSLLFGTILFGFSGWDAPHLTYDHGKVIEKNQMLHVLSLYGLECVNLLMMVTFAFMISTVFRNSSLAIGLAIFLMFAGTNAVAILSFQGYEWVKYILFANTDLSQYLEGQPLVKGMTLSFSVTVLAVYFFIFNAISWIVFKKRDVAA